MPANCAGHILSVWVCRFCVNLQWRSAISLRNIIIGIGVYIMGSFYFVYKSL